MSKRPFQNRGLTYSAHMTSIAPPSLRRLASSWIDQEVVTLRKMAREGATAEEMGAALGWSPHKVKGRIKREGIVWNKKSMGRHVVLSAVRMGQFMDQTQWHQQARSMRGLGATIETIAAAVGRSEATVYKFFRTERGERPHVRLA